MQITPNSSASNANSKDTSVGEVASGVAREFHSFVADIEDLVKATTSLTGEELTRAKAKLNQRIASAKTSVEDMSETIVNRARKTAEATNTYVHEQPWNAIGASAAVGLLVGYLLARRS
ncbi:MAG: DUF883 family protein [Cellvibrio sp.]|uniref:DUF883 family protein n=1 Tax=Cellvibrio sp. TaxID=1965322 RepID=UPI00271BDFA4|nr:DUF883 family protein [Cellvibrio sp.]